MRRGIDRKSIALLLAVKYEEVFVVGIIEADKSDANVLTVKWSKEDDGSAKAKSTLNPKYIFKTR